MRKMSKISVWWCFIASKLDNGPTDFEELVQAVSMDFRDDLCYI